MLLSFNLHKQDACMVKTGSDEGEQYSDGIWYITSCAHPHLHRTHTQEGTKKEAKAYFKYVYLKIITFSE